MSLSVLSILTFTCERCPSGFAAHWTDRDCSAKSARTRMRRRARVASGPSLGMSIGLPDVPPGCLAFADAGRRHLREVPA